MDYGGAVMYGLESTPSAWLRTHAVWGRYLCPSSRQGTCLQVQCMLQRSWLVPELLWQMSTSDIKCSLAHLP